MKQIRLIPIGRFNYFGFLFILFGCYCFGLILLLNFLQDIWPFIAIILFFSIPTYLIIKAKDQYLVFLYMNQSEIFERVLFKKKRHFQWDEVVDVGIGVNPIQAYKNANFYVSRRPVTEYEIMHVYDMRKDPDVILIRYSKKAYQALKTFCPIEIKQDELVPQINKSIIK